MNISTTTRTTATLALCWLTAYYPPASAAKPDGWSIVPYVGTSLMRDQSPVISDTNGITDGQTQLSLDTGFTAGLAVRYHYTNSRWSSEFGWEYRSNDALITTAEGSTLPGGNYASNIFYLNRRYALTESTRLTPWAGGGITWIQEVDLDSEGSGPERSFSDSGTLGLQAMVGVDYQWSETLYFTSELKYSSHNALKLSEEGGTGLVTELDYQPVTLSIGIGYRF